MCCIEHLIYIQWKTHTVLYGFHRKACIRTEVDEERLKRKKTKQQQQNMYKKSSENGVKNGFKKRFMNFF